MWSVSSLQAMSLARLQMRLTAPLVILLSSATASADGLCQGKDKDIACLRNHYQQLLKGNEPLFNEIMRTAEAKAETCKSPDAAIAFLKTTAEIGGGAAMEEYFSEAVERWALKKPKCVLDAILKLPSDSRSRTVGFLQTPMFVDKDDLDEALGPLEKDSKYKKLVHEITK
jgi:hypothetical protein